MNALNCTLSPRCEDNFNCNNTKDSYECECSKVALTCRRCVNINKRERLSSPCQHKANCTEAKSFSKCTCTVGYVGDDEDFKPGKSIYY